MSWERLQAEWGTVRGPGYRRRRPLRGGRAALRGGVWASRVLRERNDELTGMLGLRLRAAGCGGCPYDGRWTGWMSSPASPRAEALSHAGQTGGSEPAGSEKPRSREVATGLDDNHRGAGIRTRDLLLPKQARYRTAPHPVVISQQLRRSQAPRQAECARFCARLWSPGHAFRTSRSCVPLITTASIVSSSAWR